MKRNIFLIAVLASVLVLSLCSCDYINSIFKKKYTDQELFSNCSSGVVLILNQYYYEVELPNGETIYFSDYDGESLLNLTADEEEIKKNKSMSFGTGFFISQTGEILTNRHVAAPSIDNSVVKGTVKDLVKAITELLSLYQDEISNQYDVLQAQKNDCYYVDYWGNWCCNDSQLSSINAQQEELRSQYQDNMQTITSLKETDFSELSTRCISELGIAYNDTYVTSSADFKPCVLIRESQDEDTDLALIQLKDKVTPEKCYVFELPEETEENKLEINEHVAMISYNAGIQLSNTAVGIQAQLNTGNISQQNDGVKVMYSIPALQGSSGSPVINEYGELVAVNFAGLTGTQSFNFGIVTKRIKKFIGNE